jgi:general secretion pathway protein A
MYEEYYGFAQPPFNLTPDPRFLYRSASHAVALQQVLQAIQRREGFIVLTGDIGTGKTTVCRALLEQADPKTFTSLILNPFLSVEELLREVLLGFGVASRETIRSGRLASASKHELVRTLHDFLRTLAPLGASALVVIDEAQHLSPDVLEEIRVLSNLELADPRLFQILIVGQLNLLDVLQSAELRQFNQRISLRCSLQPLGRDEVDAYVAHRLTVARGARSVRFLPDAIDLVHQLTDGIPRLINLVCDRALMAGHDAQTDEIPKDLVAKAATALGLPLTRPEPPRPSMLVQPRRRSALMAAAAVLVLAAVLGYAVGYSMGESDDVSLPPVPAAPARTPAPAVAPPMNQLVRGPVPPATAGGYSVLVGTYADAREARDVELKLLAANLPVYAIDVFFPPADVRRRLLIGRYVTLADAQAVKRDIAATVPDAIVIFGWQETLRRMGDSRPIPYTATENER